MDLRQDNKNKNNNKKNVMHQPHLEPHWHKPKVHSIIVTPESSPNCTRRQTHHWEIQTGVVTEVNKVNVRFDNSPLSPFPKVRGLKKFFFLGPSTERSMACVVWLNRSSSNSETSEWRQQGLTHLLRDVAARPRFFPN